MTGGRTVTICIAPNGSVLLDSPHSTRDTRCDITDVPADVPTHRVTLQVSRITLWPWPRTVSWPEIADLKQGAIYDHRLDG